MLAFAIAFVTLLSPLGPPGPPPKVAGAPSAPPPAWIDTARGDRWLAYGSYCWTTACVDMIRPSCGDGRTPVVRVRRGEIVTFRLGFVPRDVRLDATKLAARAAPTWKATRSGIVVLNVSAARGSASYVACLRFS